MARPEVSLRKSLLSKLQGRTDKEPNFYGLLIGLSSPDQLNVVSCASAHSGKGRLLNCYEEVLACLPAGLSPCGVFLTTPKANVADEVKEAWAKQLPIEAQVLFGEGGAFVIALDTDFPTKYSVYWYDPYNREIESANLLTIVDHEEDVFKHYIKFRLQTQIPFGFEMEEDKEKLRNIILSEIVHMQEIMGSNTTAFHLCDSNVLLYTEELREGAITSVLPDQPCKMLFSHIENERTEANAKRRKTGDFSQDVIHLNLIRQISGERAAEQSVSCAPIIHHEHKEYQYCTVNIPIDVVAYIHPDDRIDSIPLHLIGGINRQLDCAMANLQKYAKNSKMYPPKPFHFLPSTVGHLITVYYQEGLKDSELEPERKQMHELLLLPLDRPEVRRCNVYHFPDEATPGGYLKNVHVGLPPSGVSDGEVYTVAGLYTYHHYMQDHFNDDKWGCAYRSLQTLISWFRFQGYTEKSIAGHKEIQQALVDIGDKEAKFVGSKQWIGSTEVSYVLDHLYGVTSKILFVSNGAELPSKARELAMHFQKQGTPIMIGGGVLAHTILGIHFNEDSGSVKFLILDPHYTGGEDLKTIQNKGWCGWKGPDFWDQTAYYNLCMPQRPPMI